MAASMLAAVMVMLVAIMVMLVAITPWLHMLCLIMVTCSVNIVTARIHCSALLVAVQPFNWCL